MNGNATFRHHDTAVLSVTAVDAPVVKTSEEFDETPSEFAARHPYVTSIHYLPAYSYTWLQYFPGAPWFVNDPISGNGIGVMGSDLAYWVWSVQSEPTPAVLVGGVTSDGE